MVVCNQESREQRFILDLLTDKILHGNPVAGTGLGGGAPLTAQTLPILKHLLVGNEQEAARMLLDAGFREDVPMAHGFSVTPRKLQHVTTPWWVTRVRESRPRMG